MCLSRSSLLLIVAVSVFLTPIVVNAQSTDRSRLFNQIEDLRGQIKQKETQLLAVADQDKANYSEFLGRRDAGICRLMPREKYEPALLIRGGGAYYSFTQASSELGSDSQISLERGQFATGLIGANYGYITDLGDVPISALTAEYSAVRDLAVLVTPSAEPDVRIEQRKSGEGVKLGDHVYKGRTGASVDHTYVLRCVSYDRSDTLVAFRVVREDDDGSLTLTWKIVTRFPTPQLIRGDSR